MISFPSTEFKYAGSRYLFGASLYNYLDGNVNLSLNNQQIDSFHYTCALNDLCITGELTYTDFDGKVANYLNMQYVHLAVQIQELTETYNGNLAVQDQDVDKKFEGDFIVTEIKILSRNKNEIAYKFMLVSSNWYNCVSRLSYSNYHANEPDDVMHIITSMIARSKQVPSIGSFAQPQSDNPKIYYITNGNDNLFTSVKYLLNKLFYYDVKNKTVKFIYYHPRTREYKMLDIGFLDPSALGNQSVILSMSKQELEQMTYQTQNQLGTVVQLPKTQVFKTIMNRDMYDFDYHENKVIDSSISSDMIVNYHNTFTQFGPDDRSKGSGLFESELDFSRAGSYWNNELDVYGETVNRLLGDNALIINTPTVITRCPADLVNVTIPEDISDLKTDDEAAYRDWNIRYKELTGMWITGKVVNIISPQRQTFRQNLVLFRNFVQKFT